MSLSPLRTVLVLCTIALSWTLVASEPAAKAEFSVLSYLTNLFNVDTPEAGHNVSSNEQVNVKAVRRAPIQTRQQGFQQQTGFQQIGGFQQQQTGSAIDSYGQSTNINPFLFPQAQRAQTGSGSSGSSGDTCILPQTIGTGPYRIPRWYFNPQTSRCELFYYSGCCGNENNFPTFQACQVLCEASRKRTKRSDWLSSSSSRMQSQSSPIHQTTSISLDITTTTIITTQQPLMLLTTISPSTTSQIKKTISSLPKATLLKPAQVESSNDFLQNIVATDAVLTSDSLSPLETHSSSEIKMTTAATKTEEPTKPTSVIFPTTLTTRKTSTTSTTTKASLPTITKTTTTTPISTTTTPSIKYPKPVTSSIRRRQYIGGSGTTSNLCQYPCHQTIICPYIYVRCCQNQGPNYPTISPFPTPSIQPWTQPSTTQRPTTQPPTTRSPYGWVGLDVTSS